MHNKDNNRQHRVLWQHAQANPNTFYVAPEMESDDDFNDAFLDHRITEASRIIPLTSCVNYRASDSQWHCITYQANDPTFLQHSKRHRGKSSTTGRDIETLCRKSRQRWRRIDSEFAQRVYKDVLERLDLVEGEESAKADPSFAKAVRKLREERVSDDRVSLLQHSARLMSVVFGVTMVIVGEPRQ
jgi:hypothetical protein